MRKFNTLWVAFVICLFAQVALAADPAPVVMLKQTTSKMMTSLRQNKAAIQRDRTRLYSIVNRILLPHIDVPGMSRSVIGRTAWLNSSKDQRKRFKKEFTRLVVRTYSAALSGYSNEKIRFMPIRGGVRGSRVQVNSLIMRAGGSPVPLNYRLIKKGDQWKVYDLIIDNVSLVQSYRAQFREVLARGGLTMLTNRIKQMKSMRK